VDEYALEDLIIIIDAVMNGPLDLKRMVLWTMSGI
jgi:hypothetical protein